MKFSIVASALLSVSTALAADFCDQWLVSGLLLSFHLLTLPRGSVTTSNYIIRNNLWGISSKSSGSQCTGLDSASGEGVTWHTTWSWAGDQG